LERELLALHLPPDAVDVFRPAIYLGVEAGAAQQRLESAAQLGDVALPVCTFFRQRRRDTSIVVRLQEAEREILELPLELPQAETVRERREHLAGLDGEPFACRGMAVLRGGEIDQLACET